MIGLMVVIFSLYLARVGTFVAVLPQWGGQNVPRTVKVGLTMALTLLWFGTGIERMPAHSLALDGADISWLAFGIALGQEAVLGALLGYAFGLFLVPAHIAGEFLAQEMGLSFGGQVSGLGNGSAGPLTLIFEALAILIFFGLDGHHIFLSVLDGTFQRFPVGAALPGVPMQNLIAAATVSEEWGLVLAAPVALCLFMTTVVLALMARAAPQLTLYTVGFPLRLGVGLGAMLILLPNLVEALVSVLGHFGELLTQWV